jgi:hypothetical protein
MLSLRIEMSIIYQPYYLHLPVAFMTKAGFLSEKRGFIGTMEDRGILQMPLERFLILYAFSG